VRHVLDMLGQAVAIQQFTELDCVWIGAALQPDINIAGEHKVVRRMSRNGPTRQPTRKRSWRLL